MQVHCRVGVCKRPPSDPRPLSQLDQDLTDPVQHRVRRTPPDQIHDRDGGHQKTEVVGLQTIYAIVCQYRWVSSQRICRACDSLICSSLSSPSSRVRSENSASMPSSATTVKYRYGAGYA